jgi:hypothetical protein
VLSLALEAAGAGDDPGGDRQRAGDDDAAGLADAGREQGSPASIRFVGRNSKKARRLLVGDDTYLWSMAHDHHVEYRQSGRFQACPE